MLPPAKPLLVRFSVLALLLVLTTAARVEGERLPVKVYTSADGLGSSFINYLMRDSRGFLWICTRDGLSRFDGSRFVTYQVGDKNARPGIEQILESRQGIYWIVTTGGLYRFDPNAAPATPANSDGGRPILNAQFVSDTRGFLYEGINGELWLLDGRSFGLMTETDGKVVFSEVELTLPDKISVESAFGAIYQSQDGSLWLGTSTVVIRRFPSGKTVVYHVAEQTAQLRNIVEDGSGRIWVGALDHVTVIKPGTEDDNANNQVHSKFTESSFTQSPLTLPEQPNQIFEYKDHPGPMNTAGNYLYKSADRHLWISNDKTVLEFDGQSFRTYSGAEGFIEGTTQFAEDGSGNLWLGGNGGLMRIDRVGMRSFFASDGMSNTNVLVINQTRDDRLYQMTRDLSLNLFDGKRFHSIGPSWPSNTDVAWLSNPAYQDSSGEWWFATTNGLLRFSATSDSATLAQQKPRATYNSSNGLTSNEIYHVWEDSHHDLWIVTRGNKPEGYGLTRWDRATEQLVTLTEGDGLPAKTLMSSFAEDRAGNLWFGDYSGQMFRYAGGRFTKFTAADGVPTGLITALHLDRQGRLWIGSAEVGVAFIDDPTADHPRWVMPGDILLSSNNVRSLTEDLFGNIYVGTARGVDRLSPDAKRIKHFSINDGLAGDFVATSFRDGSGALWFGTPSGLSKLVPVPEKDNAPPPVLISGLRVAGERRAIPELGNISVSLPELGHSQNNLQIEFFGIDLSASESLRYEYKLDGADRGWSAPTAERTVTYANLQPGRYTFQVRSINAAGLSSDHPAMVSFRILSPIWLRSWFIALAFLFGGGLLFVFYRYRMAHLQQVNAALMEARTAEQNLRQAKEERLAELERVRKRIATDLHDDIGSSLTRISLLSEVAQRQGSDGALPTIAGLSRELVDSMSDIVWAINPERDSLGDLTQRMRHFAGDVFNARGIDFRLSFPESERDLRLGANLRRELFLIFKEAVNNCVKHSACSEASVEFRLDGGLCLKLSDKGRGFDVAGKSSGHGLASMRARTEGLGGKFEIESTPGVGTTLTFLIPLSLQEAGAGAN